MVYIYTIKLEKDKYYVGKTNNPQFRITSHFNSNGSQWTKLYKPIKILEIKPNCDDYDEDKITIQCMDKYGINNVRGGSFVSVKLDKSTIDILNKMINGSNNKCFVCGKAGHFAKDCKKKDNNEKYKTYEVWSCFYCGKDFDSYKGATFHQNFYCKNKINNYYEDSEEDSEEDSQEDSEEDSDEIQNTIMAKYSY